MRPATPNRPVAAVTGRTGCRICRTNDIAAVLKQLRRIPRRPGAPGSDPARVRAGTGQPLNIQAGAVHAAGWATLDGEVTLVREDVGRHNALDKLIGALYKGGINPAGGFVVVTSRASFEMVQKTTVLGAPLMASISGPTGLAIRVAQQAGLTLVGFTREGRTVYLRAGWGGRRAGRAGGAGGRGGHGGQGGRDGWTRDPAHAPGSRSNSPATSSSPETRSSSRAEGVIGSRSGTTTPMVK
jgi:FdhD protein